jgi:hypothetical protein
MVITTTLLQAALLLVSLFGSGVGGQRAGGVIDDDDSECELAALVFGATWRAGDSGPLPYDFPPPPDAARLCGSSAPGNRVTVVYTYGDDLNQRAILDYYLGALPPSGFTADEQPVPQGIANPDRDIGITRDAIPVAMVTAHAIKRIFYIVLPVQ